MMPASYARSRSPLTDLRCWRDLFHYGHPPGRGALPDKVGTLGSGPFPIAELDTFLEKRLAFVVHDLEDSASSGDNVILWVLGHEVLNKSLLKALQRGLEASRGQEIILYTQEMLLLALLTGNDPLTDARLAESLARSHPMLAHLREQGLHWPAPRLRWESDEASPLAEASVIEEERAAAPSEAPVLAKPADAGIKTPPPPVSQPLPPRPPEEPTLGSSLIRSKAPIKPLPPRGDQGPKKKKLRPPTPSGPGWTTCPICRCPLKSANVEKHLSKSHGPGKTQKSGQKKKMAVAAAMKPTTSYNRRSGSSGRSSGRTCSGCGAKNGLCYCM
jgi:hypothetical protein